MSDKRDFTERLHTLADDGLASGLSLTAVGTALLTLAVLVLSRDGWTQSQISIAVGRAVDGWLVALRTRKSVQEVNIAVAVPLDGSAAREVKLIPHAGKCSACELPAHVLGVRACPDGSVATLYAGRKWHGALYPACAAHSEADCILPSKNVVTS